MTDQRFPRPASPKKAAAARSNGAKSRGPISPQGKSRSSQNAVTHGCYVNAVLLVNEEPAPWEALLLDFINQFQPNGKVELGLVEEMASSHWRMRRYWFAEAAALDIEMLRQQPSLEAKNPLLTEPQRLACAISHFTAQPGCQTLQFYQRVEARLRRNYSRALTDLLKIQHRRLQSQPAVPQPAPTVKNDETNPPASQPPTPQPLAASQSDQPLLKSASPASPPPGLPAASPAMLYTGEHNYV